MIINNDPQPRTSFLSMEKDMHTIANMILKNPRLKRLLYYNSQDALEKPNVTDDQALAMFGKNVKIVPKLYVDGSVLTYIIISFDNFTQNATNPEFRDNIIEFDIICHFDQWQLKDFQLRPYKIAAELDYMFNDRRLSGIGKLEFLGANQIILTDEYAGLCLMYQAVHGEEDKKNMLNPKDEKQYQKDFEELING